jgi:hypothetical protein
MLDTSECKSNVFNISILISKKVDDDGDEEEVTTERQARIPLERHITIYVLIKKHLTIYNKDDDEEEEKYEGRGSQ